MVCLVGISFSNLLLLLLHSAAGYSFSHRDEVITTTSSRDSEVVTSGTNPSSSSSFLLGCLSLSLYFFCPILLPLLPSNINSTWVERRRRKRRRRRRRRRSACVGKHAYQRGRKSQSWKGARKKCIVFDIG